MKKIDPFKGLKITYIKGEPDRRHADFRERQYNEIRNNKNIIRYSLPDVSEQEESDAHDWWLKHKCFIRREFWDHHIELWTPYPDIHLIPTSIGITINVVCPICKEEKNVTDYTHW